MKEKFVFLGRDPFRNVVRHLLSQSSPFRGCTLTTIAVLNALTQRWTIFKTLLTGIKSDRKSYPLISNNAANHECVLVALCCFFFVFFCFLQLRNEHICFKFDYENMLHYLLSRAHCHTYSKIPSGLHKVGNIVILLTSIVGFLKSWLFFVSPVIFVDG